jgi:hypothetical protein
VYVRVDTRVGDRRHPGRELPSGKKCFIHGQDADGTEKRRHVRSMRTVRDDARPSAAERGGRIEIRDAANGI